MASKEGGNGTVGRRLAHVFPHALPVVLAYLVIGIPCGVLEAQIGFGPLLALAFSSTFYTGAGQFVLPQMVLAGMPLPTTIASIVLVSSRQLLYSAGLAPTWARVRALTRLRLPPPSRTSPSASTSTALREMPAGTFATASSSTSSVCSRGRLPMPQACS